MFGERMVLMEGEDGNSGGGYVAPLQKLLPNANKTTVGSYAPDTIASGFATEAKPAEADEYDAPRGGGEEQGANRGGHRVGGPAANKFVDKKVSTDTGMRLKGRLDVPRPADEQAIYDQAEKDIFDAEQRTMIAEGEAMGFTEVLLSDAANIGQADAIEGRRLHQEHFAKAKQRTERLYRNVEEASSLQVNPYNWHQSIGKGGRVAAAFSLLTGQMAAGAGNPNSALKMMEAAIERDLAAQEQNIKTKFDALKLERGLNQDERALYQEELASLNETRAIAYSAITGRIAAAKQHAMNEAHYAATEVMEDHFNIKKLNAIQAARQNIHVEVDQATSAAKLRIQLREIEKMKSQLIVGSPLSERAEAGPGAAPRTGTSAGQTSAETGLQRAPGRAGSVGGRTGSRAKAGTTPQAGSQAQEGTATAAPLEAPTSGAGTPQQVERDGMSMMETQDEADERYAKEYDAQAKRAGLNAREARRVARAHVANSPARTIRGLGEKFAAGGGLDEGEMWGLLTKKKRQGGGDVPNRVANAGGYGLAMVTDPTSGTGESSLGITSVHEGAEAVLGGVAIPNGGMLLTDDARLVSKQIPAPKRGQFKDVAQYKRAKAHWQRGQDYPEIYEGRAKVEDEKNTIIAGGRLYRLSNLSDARTDPKKFKEMKEKIAQQTTGQKGIMALAKQIRTHGLQGIFTPEGGINIPGLNTNDPATLGMINKMITNAMTYIKTHDPTARISDKDLEVGMQAMGDFMGKGAKALDFLQSLDGDSKNNTKRIQVERFFATIAIASQEQLWDEFEDDLVPTYNTMVKADKEALELRKFIDLKRVN